MAEDLNKYFIPVFTKEVISSLPLCDRKFEDDESNHLRQLFLTPEIISKNKMMIENKLPVVDGILPKLLKETVDEISIPLANLLICHLKRELFHQNGRMQMIHHNLKGIKE